MTKKDFWQPTNLADMFFTISNLHAEREALRYKIGHHYESLTYFELKKEVIQAAIGFRALGIKRGDKAMIISENRPEWVITDLALITLGAINVPLHGVLSPSQLSDVIEETRPVAIFFSGKEIQGKLLEVSKSIENVSHFISFEKIEETEIGKLIYFKSLLEKQEATEKNSAELIENALMLKPNDVSSIIYTSGTSGHLKGVQLSHENFIQNILGTLDIVEILPTDKFFSILPLSHVFERAAGYYIALMVGASVGFCTDLNNLSTEIKERKPTVVLAVPRLFEKIYEKIIKKTEQSFVKNIIFKLAFSYKRKNKEDRLANLFDKLVFSKIRAEFGGEVRFFVSGGASLPEKIGRFFDKAGLMIIEGYGLTETTSVAAGNGPSFNKFGTVGRPAFNLDIKLGKDNEILIKGPSVMVGYVREADNKLSFTEDGYFKTGDLGVFDEAGYLKISGRKKDLMVLTTGKKVAPTPIEAALEMSPYIEQAMVTGDAKKHIVGVLHLDFERLSKEFNEPKKSRLIKNEKVIELVERELERATHKFSSIERVRKYVLITEPFTIENGELTPSFKLRRHIIRDRYAAQIEEIYG